MGSLMAGWDSHVKDPNNEKLMRNKSLTKEEIEVFWKIRKQKEEEHLKHISLLSPRSQANAIEEALSESSLENLIHKNGWWISSNSAFLNEPPVIEGEDGSSKRYAAQFHVASIATPDQSAHTADEAHKKQFTQAH